MAKNRGVKINRHAKNLGGKGCFVREAEVKFLPKTGEGAAPKAQLNPRTAAPKMKGNTINDSRRLTGGLSDWREQAGGAIRGRWGCEREDIEKFRKIIQDKRYKLLCCISYCYCYIYYTLLFVEIS